MVADWGGPVTGRKSCSIREGDFRRANFSRAKVARGRARGAGGGAGGELDDFWREMWLLLVAAGSGYLAKCWQRTLQPRHQLADFAHADVQPAGDERAGGRSSTPPPQQLLLETSPQPNALPPHMPRDVAERGDEESKPAKRTFSPKALGKKLFSSDSGKGGKATKSRADRSEGANLSSGTEKSSSRWSPRSSFRLRKSSAVDVAPEENSNSIEAQGCFPTSESFRKRRERRRTETGSSSSRSLQRFLGEGELGPSSLGSSRRESDAGDSSARSFLGAAEVCAEVGDRGGSDNSPDVAGQLRAPAGESGPKLPGSGSPLKLHGLAALGSSNGQSAVEVWSPSVADVVNRMEKGKRPAAVEEFLAPKGSPTAGEGSLEGEGEAFSGGKGKRRAWGGRKATVEDSGEAVSAVLLSGKRSKDSSDLNENPPRESGVGVTVTSITCKRVKDVSKLKDRTEDFDETSPSSAIGIVDLSQAFFGFDKFFGSPEDTKSPYKHYRRTRYLCRSGYRKTMRKMRESPRPVSALESCLQAQFPHKDERSGVARSLNFSTLMGGGSQRQESAEPGAETSLANSESCSSPRSLIGEPGESESERTSGVLGLPELKSPSPKGSTNRGARQFYDASDGFHESKGNYPRKTVLEDRGRVAPSNAKVTDVLWRPTKLPVALKKRKLSQACVPCATAISSVAPHCFELEALVIPPMEGLLFSFGVGIGVMSLLNEPDGEIQRLSEELQNSEEKIENLSNSLRQDTDSSVQPSEQLLEQAMIAGVLATESVLEGDCKDGNLSSTLLCSSVSSESGKEVLQIYSKEAPQTPQQIEHMAELEAELEAELDALTSGITDGSSEAPDYEELDPDGVAGVADRDIGVDGLPALLEWDDDNDDFITDEPAHASGGVPPKELSRLLRKVESSRQVLLIAELEAELNEKVEKLQLMEKELLQLKEKTASVGTPSAGVEEQSATSASVTPSKDLGHGYGGLLNAYIEKLNQSEVKDPVHHPAEDVRKKRDEVSGIPFDFKKSRARLHSDSLAELKMRVNSKGTAQSRRSSDFLEPVSSCPEAVRRESRDNEPEFYLRRAISGEVGSKTQGVARTLSAGGTKASFTSMPKATENKAQADNDAVCDEFLSSVLGSPEGRSNGLATPPLEGDLFMPFSPDQDTSTAEDGATKDSARAAAAKAAVEDLDKVVGQLIKRDSSNVKNALNALLRWEAEDDELPSKEDAGEERTVSHHLRRPTAGKNPTPQSSSYASSPQKISLLTGNLGLLRSSSLGEKFRSADNRSPHAAEDGLEVFQPSSPNVTDRSVRAFGQKRDGHMFKKDHSPRTSRREVEKYEASPTRTLRDKFRSESPVFGATEANFQSVLDARRELRYSSSKVQLFKAGSIQRQGDAADAPDVYRYREDGRRAGTTSPTGRPSASFQRRLYRHPTSDWVAEVGSPPDEFLRAFKGGSTDTPPRIG